MRTVVSWDTHLGDLDLLFKVIQVKLWSEFFYLVNIPANTKLRSSNLVSTFTNLGTEIYPLPTIKGQIVCCVFPFPINISFAMLRPQTWKYTIISRSRSCGSNCVSSVARKVRVINVALCFTTLTTMCAEVSDLTWLSMSHTCRSICRGE